VFDKSSKVERVDQWSDCSCYSKTFTENTVLSINDLIYLLGRIHIL